MKKITYILLCLLLTIGDISAMRKNRYHISRLISLYKQPKRTIIRKQRHIYYSGARTFFNIGNTKSNTDPFEQQASEYLAKEFINTLQDERKGPQSKEFNIRKLQEYLNDRVTSATKIINKTATAYLICKERKFLDRHFIFLFAMNHLDSNPLARIHYFFPKTTEELHGYLLRKELKCYAFGKLRDFEKELDLKKVSKDEYQKAFETWGGNKKDRQIKFDALGWKASRLLANHTLKILQQTNPSS